MIVLLPLLVMAGFGESARARVLEDTGGFEAMPVGPMRDGRGWQVGVASPGPQIVDLNDGTFGKVMRVFGPEAPGNSNSILSFEPQHRGTLVISFDMWTNTNYRSLYLLVTTPDATAGDVFYKTTTSICWGAVQGRVAHYAGRWLDVAPIELERWRHVDVLIYLSGPRAGTLDINLDGGKPEATDLPWRQRMELTPRRQLGQVWFMGYGRPASKMGGSEDRYFQIDNAVITHVPERDATAEDEAIRTSGGVTSH